MKQKKINLLYIFYKFHGHFGSNKDQGNFGEIVR